MSVDINVYKKTVELLRSELSVLRAKGKISQDGLAKKIGVSRQTYNSIENGKREMPRTIFFALIAYFHHNNETRDMLENIDGLMESVKVLIALNDEENLRGENNGK